VERSAEFYRGAKWIIDGCCDPSVAHALDRLLAEAEAREASVPTAADVIAAAERALEAWMAHMKQPAGVSGSYGALLESLAVAQNSTEEAISLIAKWKEAHNA
jgi:hypothetical protein